MNTEIYASPTSIYYSNPNNSSFLRNVGYAEYNDYAKRLFSDETINIISKKVTELTKGVHPSGRPIVVPNDKIAYVIDTIYQDYRPPTQDIYGRYNIPLTESGSYYNSIVNQTIELITSDIRNTIETDIKNSKLSVWTTILGDFNAEGLRAYPPIKTRERKWQSAFFFENY